MNLFPKSFRRRRLFGNKAAPKNFSCFLSTSCFQTISIRQDFSKCCHFGNGTSRLSHCKPVQYAPIPCGPSSDTHKTIIIMCDNIYIPARKNARLYGRTHRKIPSCKQCPPYGINPVLSQPPARHAIVPYCPAEPAGYVPMGDDL